MTLNQAFAIRVREYLKEKNMTQYKLEQSTGIYHSTMTSILNNKTKAGAPFVCSFCSLYAFAVSAYEATVPETSNAASRYSVPSFSATDSPSGATSPSVAPLKSRVLT